MSYALMILDLDEVPDDITEFLAALEQAAGEQAGERQPSEKLCAFLDAVNEVFPSLADDPANSPWSLAPAHSVTNGGLTLGFSISNSERLFDVFMEFEEIAWRLDLIICDPQEGTFRRPRLD